MSGVNPGRRQPLAMSASKHKTSTRKEPQKEDSASSILESEGAHSRKYLLGHFYDEIKPVLTVSLVFLNMF